MEHVEFKGDVCNLDEVNVFCKQVQEIINRLLVEVGEEPIEASKFEGLL